ncbi:hypothetical protein, partial [Pseudomonas sp. Sample_11]|uniref:hypothetical protein n=1 Tax=Pseudomonas sp. Sample_11 TaxID=2448261 RepID=UPI0019D4FE73
FASKLAPTMKLSVFGRYWLDVGALSLASQLPQGSCGFRERWVGCQAAFASKLAPTMKLSVFGRYWLDVGALSLASQLPQGSSGFREIWVAARPHSRAGSLPQNQNQNQKQKQKQSSAAARGEAAPLNNERKLECF